MRVAIGAGSALQYSFCRMRMNLSSTTVAPTTISKVLVVGSGVIGLRTALELAQRNVEVVLRSPYPPLDPRTTSMGAGGLWMPFHVESDRVTQWAKETLDEILAPEQKDMVEVMPVVQFLREHQGPQVEDYASSSHDGTLQSNRLPEWTSDPRLEFQHMTVEMLAWQNAVHRLRIPSEKILKAAGYNHAWMFQTAIVDSPRYLQYLLDQLQQHQHVDIDVATNHFYTSIDDMCAAAADQWGCDAVVNCSGAGSQTICNDASVVRARGTLLHFERQTRTDEEKDAVLLCDEPPWGSDTMPCYLIPRGDTLVIGGTYLEEDTEPSMRATERERILQNAQNLGIDIDKTPPVGEWTGFRPSRTPLRCELDTTTHSMPVVHQYGHGGSGWTLFTGSARHSVDLLLSPRD